MHKCDDFIIDELKQCLGIYLQQLHLLLLNIDLHLMTLPTDNAHLSITLFRPHQAEIRQGKLEHFVAVSLLSTNPLLSCC